MARIAAAADGRCAGRRLSGAVICEPGRAGAARGADSGAPHSDLPVADASVDGVFAHMLLCMALSTGQIHHVLDEVRRVLRPGGAFVYAVRHTGDAHYRTGIARGQDIFEHGGFAVHFFPRRLVEDLAEGWKLIGVDPF
jgi:SAM-dependent methyltransferase